MDDNGKPKDAKKGTIRKGQTENMTRSEYRQLKKFRFNDDHDFHTIGSKSKGIGMSSGGMLTTKGDNSM
jgi:hypothetical protein